MIPKNTKNPEAQRLGRLGKGKPKHYSDPDKAREQRRLAGIASGKARRRQAENNAEHRYLMNTIG